MSTSPDPNPYLSPAASSSETPRPRPVGKLRWLDFVAVTFDLVSGLVCAGAGGAMTVIGVWTYQREAGLFSDPWASILKSILLPAALCLFGIWKLRQAYLGIRNPASRRFRNAWAIAARQRGALDNSDS